MTDIDRLKDILRVLPAELQQEAFEILTPVEASFSTYELPYIVSQLLKFIEGHSNTKECFEYIREQLPIITDACSLYSTKSGNPVSKLRVVAIDALAIQDMLGDVVLNRNFISEQDREVLIANLTTWAYGRVNGSGKRCCSPTTTCQNPSCRASFLDPDKERASLTHEETGRHVWRCPDCDLIRHMCTHGTQTNGRCMKHGGKKGIEIVSFGEAHVTLTQQYLRGTRRDVLAKIMKNPEDALSNADSIYLLSVRMVELTEQLGSHNLTIDDVDTLNKIRKNIETDRKAITLVDELIAELYERDEDEQLWEKINDQAQGLNKLRVGQSTILKNTQSALSEAQKRKLGEQIISAIQLGVSNAVAETLPMLQGRDDLSVTDIRALMTTSLVKAIRKEIS